MVSDPASDRARGMLAEDDRIITWAWSLTEVVTAVERRAREVLLSRSQRRAVLGSLDRFADQWDEVSDILGVRRRANLLLARLALRAADAGQLGAALLLQEQLSHRLTFVCLDERLAATVKRESLHVLPVG